MTNRYAHRLRNRLVTDVTTQATALVSAWHGRRELSNRSSRILRCSDEPVFPYPVAAHEVSAQAHPHAADKRATTN